MKVKPKKEGEGTMKAKGQVKTAALGKKTGGEAGVMKVKTDSQIQKKKRKRIRRKRNSALQAGVKQNVDSKMETESFGKRQRWWMKKMANQTSKNKETNTAPPKEPLEQKKRNISEVDTCNAGVGDHNQKSQDDGGESVSAKRLKTNTDIKAVSDPHKNGKVHGGEGKTMEKKKRRRRRKWKSITEGQNGDGTSDVNMKEQINAGKTNGTKKMMPPSYTLVTNRPADSTGNMKPKKKARRKKKLVKKFSSGVGDSEIKEGELVREVSATEVKETGNKVSVLKKKKKKKGKIQAKGDAGQKENMSSSTQKKKMKKKPIKFVVTEQDPKTLNKSSSCDDRQTSAQTSQPSLQRDEIAQLCSLHPSVTSIDHKEKVKTCWAQNTNIGIRLQEGEIEVFKTPFTCCYLTNLLENEDFLEGVKQELEPIQLVQKSNDLYKFQQTEDLKNVTSPYISRLRDLLYTEVRQWLMEVTDIPLNDTVDMGSSRYNHTDVLLCHDDELEGRRIAYILYLVPSWLKKDGGSLDLFSMDDNGDPKEVVKSLFPQNNAFAFFEVSPKSLHQVSEVLSLKKTRLSINGWFHGPPLPRPQRRQPPPPPMSAPGHVEEDDFFFWINPAYLNTEMQKDIREKFCSESQLELENFLTDEAYEKLSEALKGKDLAWECTGPRNRQYYEVVAPDNLPQDIKECQQFLQCEAFFLVLSQLTGLKLHAMAPQDSDDDQEEEETSTGDPNPQCRMEVQQWSPGRYTLIRDDCVDQQAALDVYLHANVSEEWTQELGGHVTYLTKDEDEELLTILPRSNCLSLVYRDTQTLHFTKYINSAASLALGPEDSRYQCFAGVYHE